MELVLSVAVGLWISLGAYISYRATKKEYEKIEVKE